MKTKVLLFSLVIAWASFTAAAEQPLPSPPEVYQAFLIALLKGDSDVVSKLALPNKELALLLSGARLPAAQQKEAISQIEANPYRVLKIGETFRLPNSRILSPTEEMEKQGRVIIVSSADPLPHLLQKTEAGWRVDAGDLIAARKAAAQLKR